MSKLMKEKERESYTTVFTIKLIKSLTDSVVIYFGAAAKNDPYFIFEAEERLEGSYVCKKGRIRLPFSGFSYLLAILFKFRSAL